MPTLEELRSKWAVEPTKPEQNERVNPQGTRSPEAIAFGPDDAIVWSEAEVRGWARSGEVISNGTVVGMADGSKGVSVLDFRFKSGRFAGKTVKVAASTNGRGYLRWWYCQIQPDAVYVEGMRSLVRLVLGESDEVIREKAGVADG